MAPHLIFGCASVGKNYATKEEVEELTRTLQSIGLGHLDTAARYPPTSPGLSEKLLGEATVGASFLVDTKILISGDGRGHLSEANIAKSIEQSYESLKVTKINILYCHGPDKQTPIAEQAAAFDKFYREGKFKHVRRFLEQPSSAADRSFFIHSSAFPIFLSKCLKNGSKSQTKTTTSNQSTTKGSITYYAEPTKKGCFPSFIAMEFTSMLLGKSRSRSYSSLDIKD